VAQRAALVETRAATTLAFLEVLAAQERAALADTLLTVADQILESVTRRVQAGALSPVEENRARLSREVRRIRRDRERRSLQRDRARLAARWGGTDTFGVAVGTFTTAPSLPPLSELDAEVDAAPDLVRRDAAHATRLLERDAARTARFPGLELSAGVKHSRGEDDTALRLAVAAPLPLFNGNRAAVAAADARVRAGEREREAETRRLRSALADAHARLASAIEEAHALEHAILPEARAAFEAVRDTHDRGRTPLTDVLDVEEALFELRGRHVEVLQECHQAAIDLERMLGRPIPGSLTQGAER
jgi:cobalt-zinc-cadmium efflux system outer membrane protein